MFAESSLSNGSIRHNKLFYLSFSKVKDVTASRCIENLKIISRLDYLTDRHTGNSQLKLPEVILEIVNCSSI
jgi:hypothetical protein